MNLMNAALISDFGFIPVSFNLNHTVIIIVIDEVNCMK